jgi:aspartate carbamoyltransferase catalytic subunit
VRHRHAGDGAHEHPTQGLQDLLTVQVAGGHARGVREGQQVLVGWTAEDVPLIGRG